jgi:integrase
MPSIRSRNDNGLLFLEFRCEGQRCREQTLLNDTPSNRKTLQKVLDKIESEINAGSFVYENYFPNSKALERIAKARADRVAKTSAVAIAVEGSAQAAGTVAAPVALGPTFKDFANQWVDEHSIEWRRSHIKSLLSTLNGRLIPEFGSRVVGSISKADVLAYRASLAKVQGRGDKIGLSPKRINEIMGLLRQILNEAADRFEFTSPLTNIKKLRQPRADVDPLSLVDVQRIIATVRPDYKDYFITRFFTGMRTGEVHGLKWKYVDFDLRVIRVRETFILGEDDYTKTDGSQRDIQMSQPVYDAMKRQLEVTGKLSDYAFCNLMGQPLDNKNFTDRVWYPLLRHLDLKQRRPYQMRHTAATLWLAAGAAAMCPTSPGKTALRWSDSWPVACHKAHWWRAKPHQARRSMSTSTRLSRYQFPNPEASKRTVSSRPVSLQRRSRSPPIPAVLLKSPRQSAALQSLQAPGM